MEENKQEVVENSQQPNQSGLDEANKYALMTFIMACVGFTVCGGWIIGGVACAVLGFISRSRLANSNATKQPYKGFQIATKYISIVDIVFGLISAIGYTIALIVTISPLLLVPLLNSY